MRALVVAALLAKQLFLSFSRPINLFAHGVAASAVLMRCQFLKGNRGNFNMQIDSVE